MSKKRTIVIAGLAGLGLLALSRKASASDVIGPIFPVTPVDPPVGPGGEEPIDPGFVEPPPPPPPPNVNNYVGSGFTWPNYRANFPTATSIGTAFVALGYPISFTPGDTQATIPFNMISSFNMTTVREFQRDYNAAVNAQTVDDDPSPKVLATDGLVGNNTLRAMLNARRWVNVLGVSWADIVALAA